MPKPRMYGAFVSFQFRKNVLPRYKGNFTNKMIRDKDVNKTTIYVINDDISKG